MIDWKTSEANLKATFPLTAANPRRITGMLQSTVATTTKKFRTVASVV
jgi:hypothetical protein